ncbi:DUF1080 domain-containing protein [Roseiconus nitratireducens]|uniref:DUF1080 domain-containing protein n=1 Tax=Roseiconus nitratireducens TaxID=2605748 RepID=A0A5M6D041_9BACT|nr:family 16 glycoside hydrolase [Roseiconus nitratireducens]KAA5540476.1 DUF1080 domain-containing protein [Roseiconus nitratireducens]
MRFALLICVASFWLLSPQPSLAQEAPPTDPDFRIQGEYVGDDQSMQVIARGDGLFDILVDERGPTNTNKSAENTRRLEGDQDLVAELAEAMGAERVERQSPTLGVAPPERAVVLFDGTEQSLDRWVDGEITADGLLKQGTQTRQRFRDYSLHLEFRTPWMPDAKGQQRGNSGVYHQGRYETQILDSFGLRGAINETGAIYGVKAPDVNACLPPMQWQTYDIDFTAARYDGPTKTEPARMTVRLNGIIVQNDVAVPNTTTAAPVAEGADDGPLYLQDHGNPVRFRNIWLIPRDATMEAARPIVPGFERFFARSADPEALGGELLISTLACTACHPGADGVLPVKRGPNLSNVRSRIRPDALVDMIADAHQTKRGTKMPDVWADLDEESRTQAAEAIASYLMLDGAGEGLLDRPTNRDSVARGEELYHSVGCVACHTTFAGPTTPSSTTVPLGDLPQKYTVDSLATFLIHPHQVRPGARMPALVGSRADAYAIASYLTSRVTLRENTAQFRRTIYRGEWEKLPDLQKLAPVANDRVSQLEINDLKDPNNFAMVFESQISVPSDARYTFSLASDDGSRLFIGPHVIDNDGVHPHVEKRKTFQLKAGIHPVRVEYFNAQGERSLEVFLRDPLRGRVHLREVIVDEDAKVEPELLVRRFSPDPSLKQQGQTLFRSRGCASCHQFQESQYLPLQAPPLAKVRSDRGCLAESVRSPAVDFHLTPSQRAAITRSIDQRRSGDSPAVSITDQQLVHLTMAGLNCYACHRRDAVGGPETARDVLFKTTTAEMGWEGRLPPPLNGIGDKLKDTYLQELLANGANARPYMLTRMPGYGPGHLDLFVKSVQRLDRQNGGDEIASAAPATDTDGLVSEGLVSDGRKLVGGNGLACIKCHAYGDQKGGGIGAIDLLTMPTRLRQDWFNRYLQDPTKYRPGTRMPNSFTDGRSSYTKLYDGDPDQQIHAMWTYLNAGKSAKEPAGLRADSILLRAADRPRIYRNFFEGVSGRGIAVGYPAEINLIWDAEQMSLAKIWKNAFIDASRHWNGRGAGRTSPVGDQVVTLESWPSLAKGQSIQMDWPSSEPRSLGYRFGGYSLDAAGNPTFLYSIGDASIEDAIEPVNRDTFSRTLTIRREGNDSGTPLIWRIAVGKITADGDGYRVDDLRLQINGADCQIVDIDGRSELRAMLPAAATVTLTEQIAW